MDYDGAWLPSLPTVAAAGQIGPGTGCAGVDQRHGHQLAGPQAVCRPAQGRQGRVINPGLVPLAEETLSFHHRANRRSRRRLAAVPGSQDPSDAFGNDSSCGQPGRASGLRYRNGLLSRSTRLNVRAGQSVASVSELKEILDVLPVSAGARAGACQALSRAVRPLRNLLLLNVAVDPQAHLTERGLHKLSARNDSLGFSGARDNLVVTIDQITLNSWHEVSLQHYAAGDTLIQCLKNVLAQVAINPAELPDIRVMAPSRGHGQAIARRVSELFADVLRQFFAGGTGPHPLRYIIEMDQRISCCNSMAGNRVCGPDSRAALMDALLQPQGSR